MVNHATKIEMAKIINYIWHVIYLDVQGGETEEKKRVVLC